MPAASPIVDRAVAAGTPLLFLSAHLDDAVLSCGALMESVKHSSPITVATLFTAAACPPHTRAADAAALFAERRAEDVEVLGRWVSTTCTSSRPTRPVGVGRHVGHLITRAVGAGQHVDVVYSPTSRTTWPRTPIPPFSSGTG
jgi:hypothetical protein